MTAQTLQGALREARARLSAAGIDAAPLEARLLLATAAGCDSGEVIGHPERPIDDAAVERLASLVNRRIQGEPVAYLLGRREFWSLDLAVSPATLIPRPESETLVDAALAFARGQGDIRLLLDLGTGSGCLMLALLSELPDAFGIGVDIAEDALRVARANAERVGLARRAAFLCADWSEALAGGFDLIVANPPYVAKTEAAGLPYDVSAFEPARALFGGEDGASSYRRILPELPKVLARHGAAFVEIGGASAPLAIATAAAAGLRIIDVKNDLAGRPRCLCVARQGSVRR